MTTVVRAPKQSHADARRDLRLRKAARIEAILKQHAPDLESKDVLDVGTGSGIIASYLAPRVRILQSVDVVDERTETGFAFERIDSECLPFADASFDIALSNHVIEHVDDAQLHLTEIARVLKPGGFCYLATPNRLWPIEPHFNLPFLAWLPGQYLKDLYVRKTQRGVYYDAKLLTCTGLLRMADVTGLEATDATLALSLSVIKLSDRSGISGVLSKIWPYVRYMTPSIVMILCKSAVARQEHAGGG